MKIIVRVGLLVLCLAVSPAAGADEAGQCQASSGSYLMGTVTKGPTFAPGHPQAGVELSHTHVTLRSDQDGRLYDVAIDNVFASGYDTAGRQVPAPYSSIAVGDRLELCGKLYASGGPGIDWVHTNCGERPEPDKPDGWVKIVSQAGAVGPNLAGSTTYCRLWP